MDTVRTGRRFCRPAPNVTSLAVPPIFGSNATVAFVGGGPTAGDGSGGSCRTGVKSERDEGGRVMQRSWVPLECVDCGEHWERSPADLPAPGRDFECDHCGARRPISEFVKTTQGLKILKRFHGE